MRMCPLEGARGRNFLQWTTICPSCCSWSWASCSPAFPSSPRHSRARKRPTAAKTAPYECGIVPAIEPPGRFPVRFYLVAMIFIIFDIEIVFLYPWAVIFRQLGSFGLIEVVVFAAVVFISFLFLVSNGALTWGPSKLLIDAMPSRSSNSTILRISGRPASSEGVPTPVTVPAAAASASGGAESRQRGYRAVPAARRRRAAPWVSRTSSTISRPGGSRTWSSGRARIRCGRPPSGWPAAPSR